MAHITDGECPVATSIFIRKQAEKRGVSINEQIKDYADESGTPFDTVEKWVWPRLKSAENHTAKNGGDNSQPPETITNPTPEILKDRLPQGGGAREGAGRPKYIHTETHEVTDAIMITSIIISQLERIKKSDPKREEAFEIIIKWIAANREE